MTPKRTLKLQKTVWVVSFPYKKNDDNLEAVFSRLLAPSGGPRPSKSSQNVIKVCKNEGPTFSRKAALKKKKVLGRKVGTLVFAHFYYVLA